MRKAGLACGMLTAFALAGCAGEKLPLDENTSAHKDFTMAGRWILSAPNAPVCGMNFSNTAGPNEGKVSPEGGCPEKFFLSRTWRLDASTLAINDEDSNPLAKLTFADGRFQGLSTAGTPVALAPYIAAQSQ